MNIALLGGAFDPPHLAHYQIIEYLVASGNFDQIWIIPAASHPFKKIKTPYSQRLEMCHLGFKKFGNKVKILDDEQNLSGYTIDLIKHLRQKNPKDAFFFVGGSDLKSQIQNWKDSEKLQKLVHFEFLNRHPNPNSKFLPISSTQIRKAIQAGKDYSQWLQAEIKSYIKEKNLYRKS